MRRFAARTKVSVADTRQEIESTLTRYGAKKFAFSIESTQAVMMFEISERRVRFILPLPREEGSKANNERKQKWRALLLCLKARLESVASNIETFEEAFLAHVVMPDGQTVAQHTIPTIAAAYKSGNMQPLLEPPRKGE